MHQACEHNLIPLFISIVSYLLWFLGVPLGFSSPSMPSTQQNIYFFFSSRNDFRDTALLFYCMAFYNS